MTTCCRCTNMRVQKSNQPRSQEGDERRKEDEEEEEEEEEEGKGDEESECSSEKQVQAEIGTAGAAEQGDTWHLGAPPPPPIFCSGALPP